MPVDSAVLADGKRPNLTSLFELCGVSMTGQDAILGRMRLNFLSMHRSARVWIALYLGLVILPLAALLFGERPRGGGFWWDFALVLGYAGLAMMGIQFALTARFKRAAAPFGIDLVYFFHRYLATVAFVLVLLHAAVLAMAYPGALGGVDPRVAPVHLTFGWLALIAFALLLASSWWRKRIGIEYDHWRRWHLALALLGVTLSIAHVEGSATYLASPLKQAIWIALLGFWMALVVWVRAIRPSRLQRSPYRVVEVRKERGRSWTLALVPEHPPALTYRAGQFAWLSVRASPFAMREHPFSFSSSPTRKGQLEFTIKELGDFTDDRFAAARRAGLCRRPIRRILLRPVCRRPRPGAHRRGRRHRPDHQHIAHIGRWR